MSRFRPSFSSTSDSSGSSAYASTFSSRSRSSGRNWSVPSSQRTPTLPSFMQDRPTLTEQTNPRLTSVSPKSTKSVSRGLDSFDDTPMRPSPPPTRPASPSYSSGTLSTCSLPMLRRRKPIAPAVDAPIPTFTPRFTGKPAPQVSPAPSSGATSYIYTCNSACPRACPWHVEDLSGSDTESAVAPLAPQVPEPLPATLPAPNAEPSVTYFCNCPNSCYPHFMERIGRYSEIRWKVDPVLASMPPPAPSSSPSPSSEPTAAPSPSPEPMLPPAPVRAPAPWQRTQSPVILRCRCPLLCAAPGHLELYTSSDGSPFTQESVVKPSKPAVKPLELAGKPSEPAVKPSITQISKIRITRTPCTCPADCKIPCHRNDYKPFESKIIPPPSATSSAPPSAPRIRITRCTCPADCQLTAHKDRSAESEVRPPPPAPRIRITRCTCPAACQLTAHKDLSVISEAETESSAPTEPIVESVPEGGIIRTLIWTAEERIQRVRELFPLPELDEKDLDNSEALAWHNKMVEHRQWWEAKTRAANRIIPRPPRVAFRKARDRATTSVRDIFPERKNWWENTEEVNVRRPVAFSKARTRPRSFSQAFNQTGNISSTDSNDIPRPRSVPCKITRFRRILPACEAPVTPVEEAYREEFSDIVSNESTIDWAFIADKDEGVNQEQDPSVEGWPLVQRPKYCSSGLWAQFKQAAINMAQAAASTVSRTWRSAWSSASSVFSG